MRGNEEFHPELKSVGGLTEQLSVQSVAQIQPQDIALAVAVGQAKVVLLKDTQEFAGLYNTLFWLFRIIKTNKC